MEKAALAPLLDRIRLPQILAVIIVTGYVFQHDFRHDTNALLRMLSETGRDILTSVFDIIPMLLGAEHPIVIVLILGVVGALLFFIYAAYTYRQQHQ